MKRVTDKDVQIVLEQIRTRTRENPIRACDIGMKLDPSVNRSEHGVAVRACVHHLRVVGIPICANQKGYFMAKDADELYRFTEELKARGSSIMQSANGLAQSRAFKTSML